GPAHDARRGRGHEDRERRRRHGSLRGGRQRAAADARLRAAGEDRLSDVAIRPCASLEELRVAMSAIGHYFGWEPTAEGAERFARNFDVGRMLTAWDDGALVGAAGAFGLELSVPGGSVPAAGVTLVGVLPTHRRRGL